jgi:pimeloyl-ACP methyl ester carboxylesterase
MQGQAADLVSIRTDDGILLYGAFFGSSKTGSMAVLLVHGGWGNFYTGLGRFLPGALAAAGVACLSLNNRGHDYGTVSDGEPCIGLMREQFEDCPKDVAAGLSFLKKKGYSRIVLIGHSYGSAKIAYSQKIEPDPHVEGLILCSPAALMQDVWKHYLDIPYDEAVRETRRLVYEGQGERIVVFRRLGLMPIVCTARTFLSVWGPDSAQDLRAFIGELTKPLLLTICEGDRICMKYTRAVYEHTLGTQDRQFRVLRGGDHYYIGAEGELEKTICGWISRLGRTQG